MYPGLPGDVLAMFGVSRRFFAGDLTYELRKGEPSSWFMDAIESGITQGCSYAHRARRKDVFELDGLAVQIGLGVEHRYLVLELYGESHGRIAVSRSLTHEQFDVSIPTIAWSVTDLVACTRDLYEADWLFELTEGDSLDPQPPERERIAGVIPILDRWNCGDPTIPWEGWQVEPREAVPPVVSRLNAFVGLSVRSVKEAIRELSARNPVEVAGLLAGFWESEFAVLGPGEQVSAMDMMDALGVPTLPYLDTDLERLAGGVVVSGSEAWTRFVHARLLMRRREVRRDAGDVDVLLGLTAAAIDEHEVYWGWPAQMIDWLGFAAVQEGDRFDEVRALAEPFLTSRTQYLRISAQSAIRYIDQGISYP